jgi:ech hydrogenase subunit A
MGSVFLTLLYFKVVTKLLPSDSNASQEQQQIATTYQLTSWSLVLLLVLGVFVTAYYGYMSMVQILLPAILVAVTLLLFYLSNFSTAQRSKEYNCGERDSVELGAYYFDISSKYKSLIFYSSIGLILMILIVGV